MNESITVVFVNKKKKCFYVYHHQFKKLWQERMQQLSPDKFIAKFFAGEKQKENAQSYINYIEGKGYRENC